MATAKKSKKNHYIAKESKNVALENMEKRFKENRMKPKKNHYGKV